MPATGKAAPDGLPSGVLDEAGLRGGFELALCDASAVAFCIAPEKDVLLPPELAVFAGFAELSGFAEFEGVMDCAVGAVMTDGPDGERTRGDAFISGEQASAMPDDIDINGILYRPTRQE